MTAKEIQWQLANSYGSPFFARRHLAVVPNVSWGFGLLWEADLLCMTKSGFISEIEIKISMSDWRADRLKKKFGHLGSLETRIKNFYYACPWELASRWEQVGIPEFAGVIAVYDENACKILRPAKTLPHRRCTEKEVLKLLRLAALKAWDLEPPKPRQLEIFDPGAA